MRVCGWVVTLDEGQVESVRQTLESDPRVLLEVGRDGRFPLVTRALDATQEMEVVRYVRSLPGVRNMVSVGVGL